MPLSPLFPQGRLAPHARWRTSITLLLALGVLPSLSPAADSGGRPEEILSWRHRILTEAEYARLATDWESYVRDHPADVRAIVQWGNALRYVGKSDEAMKAYTRAFHADSTDAAAIVAYVSQRFIEGEADPTWRLDHARLLRARDRDPGYPATYYTLCWTALRAGDRAQMDDCLKQMVTLGDMPRPLLDFGYNILAGAPEGAVVLTNGDNDTYPPLAVQAVESFRTGVHIVNLSLLNLPWYIRASRDSGVPIPLTDGEIDALRHTEGETISAQVQKIIYAEETKRGWKPPLYYAVTVADQNRVLPGSRVVVGLIERIGSPTETGGPVPEPPYDIPETSRLIDHVYRLESATDPAVDWDRESALRRMAQIYVQLLWKVGTEVEASKRGNGATYLSRAIAMATFHQQFDSAQHLLEEWRKMEEKH